MKKYLSIAMALLLVVCLCGCSSEGFASASTAKKLVKDYGNADGNIQVEATIDYSNDVQDVQIKIVYDLRLSKAPVTVANFVSLLLDGYYDNVVFDARYSTATALRAGRYTYQIPENEDDDLAYATSAVKDFYIKGEFPANFYEANDLVNQLGCLVMWHDGYSSTTYFDQANTQFYMSFSSTNNTNDSNFAVFATIASKGISVYVDGVKVVEQQDKFPSWVIDDLYSNNTSTHSVTISDSETTTALERLIYVSAWKFVDSAKDYSGLKSVAEKYRIVVSD